MTIFASAPGKVILTGEYAVLEGAPALVMAVDRRVSVTLTPHNRARCSVTAPGWTDTEGSFEMGAAGPGWIDGGDRTFGLAAHVLAACSRERCVDRRPFDLVMDSTALTERGPHGPIKLGLGSSAALTVALWHALSYHAASQQTAPAAELVRLIEIHAGLQGGRGSGADVAASLHGGLIEYVRSPEPRARPARLPDGLAYCFVWSGRQVATGSFLERLERWREQHPDRHAQALAPMLEIADKAAQSAGSNEGAEFLGLLDEFVPVLERLGTGAGADILSEPHRRLRRIARRCDVVYKPCGAGGGDIGVGLSEDPEALDRFRAATAGEGFAPLSLDIDHLGVQARSGNQ